MLVKANPSQITLFITDVKYGICKTIVSVTGVLRSLWK